MSMTRIYLASLAAAAIGVFATAPSAMAAPGTPSVYTDAPGDSVSAPDVQKVTLTDGGNGRVAVEIDLAAPFPDDGSGIAFGIDTDRNATTGNEFGFEYVVYADAEGVVLAKWDGSTYQGFDHTSLTPDLAGGRLTFTLTLADISSVSSFDFVVITEDAAAKNEDVAPEHGAFTFPSALEKPTIRSVMIGLTKLLPKAGKVLAIPGVNVRLSNDQFVPADSVACTLSFKGTALHPVGNCMWRIPKSYRKKHLTLKLVAGYQGATTTLTLPVIPG